MEFLYSRQKKCQNINTKQMINVTHKTRTVTFLKYKLSIKKTNHNENYISVCCVSHWFKCKQKISISENWMLSGYQLPKLPNQYNYYLSTIVRRRRSIKTWNESHINNQSKTPNINISFTTHPRKLFARFSRDW